MTDVEHWLADSTALSRKSAAQLVFEELREVILSGQFPPGTRLPTEAQLTRKYGVSRPIVREALHSLQVLGLTRTRTGSGTYVLEPPGENVSFGGYSAADLMEARPAFEIPAAGLAAVRRTEEELRRLLKLCDRMDAEENSVKWVQLDGEFHCLIADTSKNAIFSKVMSDVGDALKNQSRWIGLQEPRRVASNHEHRKIVDAIAVSSEAGAREAMEEHLRIVASAVHRLAGKANPT